MRGIRCEARWTCPISPENCNKRVGCVVVVAQHAAPLQGRDYAIWLFLVEDVDGLSVVAQFVEIQPVVSAERFFLRPDFVESVGIVECACFHDHGDVRGIVDVVEVGGTVLEKP